MKIIVFAVKKNVCYKKNALILFFYWFYLDERYVPAEVEVVTLTHEIRMGVNTNSEPKKYKLTFSLK